MTEVTVDEFLSNYSEQVNEHAELLRELLRSELPDIIEMLDVPAKVIGYCYGTKYAETICVMIPSQKGLKLGFNQGPSFPDPDGLLEGTGKISRYVVIDSEKKIKSAALRNLIKAGLKAYQERMKK